MRMVLSALNVKQTVFACPTIFEWNDSHNRTYYFRLRHGHARICDDVTGRVLVSGVMDGLDGVCDWDEVKRWSKRMGLELVDDERSLC